MKFSCFNIYFTNRIPTKLAHYYFVKDCLINYNSVYICIDNPNEKYELKSELRYFTHELIERNKENIKKL